MITYTEMIKMQRYFGVKFEQLWEDGNDDQFYLDGFIFKKENYKNSSY